MKTEYNKTIASLKKMIFCSDEESTLQKKINNLIFHKRIIDFETEDLRLLIGQNEHLDICVPLAINKLSTDPMIEGDYYSGDLLKNLLNVRDFFWDNNKTLKHEFLIILENNIDYIENFDVSDEIKIEILSSIEKFKKNIING